MSFGDWPGFLQRIRKEPRLSREEEADLVARSKQGDGEASSRLVTSHLRFVLHIARRYRRSGHSAADLLQEGTVGLLEAVKRFNPERGVRLSTYAVWWIRASIQDYVMRSRSLVRIGTTTAQKSMFVNMWRRTGDGGTVNEDTLRRLAARFNTSISDVRNFARRIARPDQSLDETVGPGTSDRWIDRLADSRPNPEERLAAANELRPRLDMLARALARLPPRERHIIRRRFFAEPRLSRAKVGAEMGLSKERVRQLEIRALATLKDNVEEGLDAALPKRPDGDG